MANESQKETHEPAQAAANPDEASSRRPSETSENPFSDRNEALSMTSRTQSTATDTPTEKTAKPDEGSAEPAKKAIPSHSPLAFANIPPVWEPGARPKMNPSAPSTNNRTREGFNAATLSVVMSSGSKKDRDRKFRDKDPSNSHAHAQHQGQSYSRPQWNVFGVDVGGLSKKPPGLSFRRQKGK